MEQSWFSSIRRWICDLKHGYRASIRGHRSSVQQLYPSTGVSPFSLPCHLCLLSSAAGHLDSVYIPARSGKQELRSLIDKLKHRSQRANRCSTLLSATQPGKTLALPVLLPHHPSGLFYLPRLFKQKPMRRLLVETFPSHKPPSGLIHNLFIWPLLGIILHLRVPGKLAYLHLIRIYCEL